MNIVNPYDLDIPNLEHFIASQPVNSACARAKVERLEKLLATKKEQALTPQYNGDS